MMRAAVLGSPISHSLSPLLHNHAYKVLGIAAEYSAIEVRSGELKKFLDDQSELSWRGFSLTMPLKEEVISLGYNVEEIALRSRSANTLYADEGSFRALSTDYLAFVDLLDIPRNSRVAIIGAGGTARSALAALNSKVSKVDIYLRNLDKALNLQDVAPELGISAHAYEELTPENFSQYDWIISTLPAQATDDLALTIARAERSLSGMQFLEVLYNPWPTELLMSVRTSGAKTIDGLDLLVEQALHQVQIFTQRDFDFTQMRTQLLKVGLDQLTS